MGIGDLRQRFRSRTAAFDAIEELPMSRFIFPFDLLV
jgi:hypothetical protein